MIEFKRMHWHAVIGLTLLASACVAPNANVATSSTVKNSGEIACLPTSTHPVCKASFTNNGSATLSNNATSSGTAVVDGKSVNFTCYAGNADRQQPRQCRW